MRKHRGGFTLIELMVTVAVMAVLAVIAYWGIHLGQLSARDTARQHIMKGITSAMERYYTNGGSYPGTGGSFVAMVLILINNSYLPAPTDPGCGSGTQPFPVVDNGDGWRPCGRVRYWWPTGTATSYSLQLDKESGGFNVFNSPL